MDASTGLYPWVNIQSIPTGHLPGGKRALTIQPMDKFELRRLRTQELIDSRLFNGVHAAFATAIGKEPSYVSRMLYVPPKKGFKRIAEEMRTHIEASCGIAPGWLDMPLGTPVTATQATPTAMEERAPYHVQPEWPFQSLTARQVAGMTDQDRDLLEGIALLMLKRHTNATSTRKRSNQTVKS